MPTPLPLNPVLKSLPVYQPGRPIEEVARELGLPAADIIKLASNENPLGPSPCALAAMQKALAGVNLYPDGNAFYLKQKLAAKLGVEPMQSDSRQRLERNHRIRRPRAARARTRKWWFRNIASRFIPSSPKCSARTSITVPAKNYGHDLPAMLRAITPQTRIVFVANPNNPTGTLAPREEVIQFVNDVPDDVLLVMDEAYIEFLDDPLDLVSLVRLGTRPNLILMRTFSKIYGLAGLRIGYGIGNPEFIAALEKIRQPFNINLLAQTAALAALDDDEHVRKTRANNFAGLKFFEQAFRESEARIRPFARQFHSGPRRRRPARVRSDATAGRDCASDGRLSIAGMDPHLHRHAAGKRALPGNVENRPKITGSPASGAFNYDVAKSTFGTSRTDGGTLKKSPSDLKPNVFATRLPGKISHLLR